MLPIGLTIACIILVIKIFGGDRALNGDDHEYSHGL